MGMSGRAEAQLGALISPGPLSRPHAGLEGLSKCQSCHERGQKVTAEKCLACHRPIADRIARRSGVHASVRGDCVTCHSEHAGVDGELRPFDQKGFNHAAVTRFALDGKHAPVAGQCASCHKARSFLTLKSSCSSCHMDVHRGALGPDCAACHSTKTAFKDLGGQFNHAKAAFPLLGAHRAVACAACHVNGRFKGLKFAACTDCHRDPHARPAVIGVAAAQRQPFGPTCTACHTNDSWRTRKINHTSQTAFPLNGRHASVDCVACHRQSAVRVQLKGDTCAACHADPHKGTFRQDCKACHNESSFKDAPFDHAATTFALTGKHQGLACGACHKNAALTSTAAPPRRGAATPRPAPRTAPRPSAVAADFRGLKTACVSCHADVHQTELGVSCETCHSTSTFKLPGYVHPRFPTFFSGQHAGVACAKCHTPEAPTRPIRSGAPVVRVKFRGATTTCVSCHRDVHLGQVGQSCETCHSVQKAQFALASFSHATTSFALTGRHETIACALCHKTETGAFPSGTGTAVRLKPMAGECRACHEDPHLGQVVQQCETCHTTHTFTVSAYRHQNRSLSQFFTGRHLTASCAACHKITTGQFPAGPGATISFQADTQCVACHTDVHRGALGRNCLNCHRP
jgi:hypothetical protein